MHIEYLDPYTLSWPDGVFPLGSDALALGEFATVRRGWRVCDLGTGSGALLLLLARRAPDLALSAVERDPPGRPDRPGQPGPKRPDGDGGRRGSAGQAPPGGAV